jgi:metal-responsive CopG/Arc/MetJ family transcriptional regulator
MTKKDSFKQINVSLAENQYQKLDHLSKALGNVSKSNLIRIAIAEFLHRNRELIKVKEMRGIIDKNVKK